MMSGAVVGFHPACLTQEKKRGRLYNRIKYDMVPAGNLPTSRDSKFPSVTLITEISDDEEAVPN
jgi:hypothetical protein